MAKDPSKKFTKQEKGWIMYDWANSIYATNIMAAIFPIYFAAVATDSGNKLYGYAISAANLLVALLAPMLGAIGDFKGMKKKLFTGFLIVGVVFTAAMAVVDSWELMLIGLVISRIGFSGSCLFYDSFLTDVTTSDRMDRVSSWGYAMGYIGGSTIPFVISIVIMVLMDMSTLSYKLAILIVPIWWLIFSIPFIKNVKQTYYVEEKPSHLAKEAFGNVIKTFKAICSDKRILLFIVAYFFYIDGVDTIISMATNYGSTLGLGTIGMVLALLVTQIVAVPFSILFGNLGKKKGGIKLISLAVVIYFIITLIGFFMGFNIERFQPTAEIDAAIKTQQTALSGDALNDFNTIIAENDFYQMAADSMATEDPAAALSESLNGSVYKDYSASATDLVPKYNADAIAAAQNVSTAAADAIAKVDATEYGSALNLSNILFWILATLVGTVQGGIQALSRSYFGQIIPPERSNEYYGFLDIFGKFSCVIGPALYALFYGLTNKASIGILSIILLFFAGALILFLGRKHFNVPLPENTETAEAE